MILMIATVVLTFPLVVVYGRVRWGHVRTLPVRRIPLPRGVSFGRFFLHTRLSLKIVTLCTFS